MCCIVFMVFLINEGGIVFLSRFQSKWTGMGVYIGTQPIHWQASFGTLSGFKVANLVKRCGWFNIWQMQWHVPQGWKYVAMFILVGASHAATFCHHIIEIWSLFPKLLMQTWLIQHKVHQNLAISKNQCRKKWFHNWIESWSFDLAQYSMEWLVKPH